jgi:hypothetical protein
MAWWEVACDACNSTRHWKSSYARQGLGDAHSVIGGALPIMLGDPRQLSTEDFKNIVNMLIG